MSRRHSRRRFQSSADPNAARRRRRNLRCETLEDRRLLFAPGGGLIAFVSNGDCTICANPNHPSWENTTSGGEGAYNAALRNFAFHTVSGGPILFVSDTTTDSNIPTVLAGDGYTVDTVLNDFSSGDNTALQGMLSSYDAVYWSASGSGNGSTHNSATTDNLLMYANLGGNVFVTGFDAIADPPDPNLIELLGGTGSINYGGGTNPAPVISDSNALTDGVVDIRGVQPTMGSAFWDLLTGLQSDTVGVASDSSGTNQGWRWTLRSVISSPPPPGIIAKPEFLVNDSTGGFQNTRAESRNVAGNAAGDLIIAYDGSGPGDSQGIFARRFDAASDPIGSAFLVNVTTSGNQTHPSVAIDPAGNSVIAWSGKGAGDNDGGVFARRYDSSGTPLSGEFRVSETVPSFQHRPVVDMADDGSFIVTWSGKGSGDADSGVFARRYDSSGIPLTGEFLVNTTTSGAQREPDISIASDGSFIVTWSGNGPGDASGVFFQRYDTGGSPAGAETRVNTTTLSQQKLPSVGIDGANNFTVVWSGRGAGDSSGVFLQRYNASASPIGSEELVNTTTNFDQNDANISMPPSGAAVVTWTSLYQDGSQRGVYVQEYSAAGAKVGGEILVNTTTFLDQKFSSVAVRGETAYSVVWSGRGVGDTNGVFAATRIRLPVPLTASSSGSGAEGSTLDGVDLAAVLSEASNRWIDTGQLSDAEIEALSSIELLVADLGDGELGGNVGLDVYLDVDAAGHGWFVDSSLGDDSEFDIYNAPTELVASDSSEAFGRIDLLTVVMHELGHALGRPHAEAPDLMAETLETGMRRLPGGGSSGYAAARVDEVFKGAGDADDGLGVADEDLYLPLSPASNPVIGYRDPNDNDVYATTLLGVDDDSDDDDDDV